MTPAPELLPEVKDLIDADLRTRLIEEVRAEWPGLGEDLGERGIGQMVAFLATSARTAEPLTPSLRVDAFWHRFLLHTVPYVRFCAALGVKFIHHVPEPAAKAGPAAGRAAMERTKAAIRAAGYAVDPEFWPGEGVADCTQCHAGCTDSPVNT
ncbi:hypothetical protein AB0A60_27980 [Streptomyces sp. NPDC046275]|uniref:hypothetical protein n=1 Tax=Streptomyces sp. NPDC046275 TaxID=3157201 RepID=UPI0033FB6D1F